MNIIQFKQVTKTFPNGTVAFDNLSFNVDEGEVVLVTGPSGSGKTTIMRLLIGEYVPNQGEILFEDHLLNKLKRQQLHHHRRKIGVVFQDYKLIEELNVWENVALPLYIRGEKQSTIEERVTDLLKLVDLTDKAMMFPRQLSGGEAQRISIARALANSPKVIFADEPTGNLDQEAGEHILKLLTKINELGTTLLIATHDPLIVDEIKAKKIDLSKGSSKSEKGDPKIQKESLKELVQESAQSNQKKNSKSAEEDNTQKKSQEKSKKKDTDQPKNKKNSIRIKTFFSKLFSKSSKKKIEVKKESLQEKSKQPSIEDLLSNND